MPPESQRERVEKSTQIFLAAFSQEI